MKRIISMIMAVAMVAVMAFAFSSCKNDQTDWERIEEEGKFVCGITLYEPMNYKDASGKLVGFDTELAEAVAEKLGVKVEFQVIDWGNKYVELNTGNIDCIWNGFTSNTKDDDGVERSEKVDFSYAYLDNAQCVVVKSDSTIKTAADLAGKTATAETGSAGATYAKSVTTKELVGKTSQMDTFTEVATGAVQFAVVDVLLAENIVGKGNFTNLKIVDTIDIDKEVYSIGCKKNSDFDEKINEALVELLNDGTLEALATKYNVHITDTLMAKKTAK